MNESIQSRNLKGDHHAYTTLKTEKSIRRFENAITTSILKFKNSEVEILFKSILKEEAISSDSLLMIFWNTSINNELLHYLNEQVYFPAFYSGRVSLKTEEVIACLRDLKETDKEIKNWSDSTVNIGASKYLTLLKKLKLMEGSLNKSMVHPFLNDKMIVLFVYWLLAVEEKPNILESQWLKYCFSEVPIFIERIMQKKYAKYFNLNYTGDKLKIEPIIPYQNIYHALTQS